MDVVVVTTVLAWLPASTVVGSAPMSTEIDVVINGKARTVAEGTSVLALLGELGLGDKRVAVERNLEVIPRAQHATTLLADGDRLEVVTFVGGG
jgi:sulfur carrier protein